MFIPIKRGTPEEILEAILSDIKGAALEKKWDSFEDKCDELRAHVGPYIAPVAPVYWNNFGLTAYESRVASLLHARINRPVTKSYLLDAIYFDRPDDQPLPKILDVFVTKIRQKLKAAGQPFHIETVWGVGYKMGLGAGQGFPNVRSVANVVHRGPRQIAA